jgi:hypothetical protein
MARRVAIPDGYDLLDSLSSLAIVGGSLDEANHRFDLRTHNGFSAL